jgi:SAM-dependent methyltransferase
VNSYTGLHAATYDAVYADKPYAEEARFVHELVGTRGGRLLDVACGTGRHASAFAGLGYDVTAVDLNKELLEIGRTARGADVRFLGGDMRDLSVEGGPFDVVTCLFDSLGYAGDNDGVVATLRSLGRHAGSGGVVVCEFLHAAAIAALRRERDPRQALPAPRRPSPPPNVGDVDRRRADADARAVRADCNRP